MPSKSTFTDVKLDVNAGENPAPGERIALVVPDSETPFRILLMGDFSGRAADASPAPVRWKPIEIDRDNLDEVLAHTGAGFDIGPASLSFRELEDFHPDRIYENHTMFESFRALRQKLGNSATASEAAAVIRGWSGTKSPAAAPPPKAEAPKPAAPPPARGGNLLDSILGATEAAPPRPSRRQDDLQSFVEKATVGSTVPTAAPDLPQLRASVDTAASARMRTLLHLPIFQSLEAAWRAAFRVVRNIETDTQLKIYLLDITLKELEADLNSSPDIRETKTWRMVVDETVNTPGGEPWALIAGNYSFGRGPSDTAILGRLAKIMRAAGAPFLAEADPKSDASQEWEQLRRSPEARSIGLAMPRFLLRAPYGKKTESLESFDFEEMSGEPQHQAYLWGNPAFACVEMLAESFSESGWDLRPGKHSTLDKLPLHVFESDGEKKVKPCAEILLTEKDTEWILDQGFMALVSIKDRDTVKLLRFQSIAKPAAALAGRWG